MEVIRGWFRMFIATNGRCFSLFACCEGTAKLCLVVDLLDLVKPLDVSGLLG